MGQWKYRLWGAGKGAYDPMSGDKRQRLGNILVDAGYISKKQLDYALGLQRERATKSPETLEEDSISEGERIKLLSSQLGIPHVELEKHYIDTHITDFVPEALAKKYNIMPYKKHRDMLFVAMVDPTDLLVIDELRFITGMNIRPAIATRKGIGHAIEIYYGKSSAEKAMEDFEREYSVGDVVASDMDIMEQIKDAPVVKLVNIIIEQAVANHASDIHIEPGAHKLRIRLRVDGELREIMSAPLKAHGPVVARIKIMSELNIAERRLPQDGRIELDIGDKILDLRVSILPTAYGEKVAIRVLDREDFLMSQKQLGLSDKNEVLFNRLIGIPHGIILVTGPTGSGKTTTLYAALGHLNDIAVNIITLEDPIEYKLAGINQIQINPKVGLTFANGLRSVLRQDPNIIMVGEIRDEETANLAIRAAITGHLVFSTLHTNDAPSSIIRLVDMGVEPYLVASSLRGVISQRLVRKICPECKIKYKATAKELQMLGLPPGDNRVLFKGKGCGNCYRTGYKGRTAVHEIMVITKEHRELINQNVSLDRLKRVSQEAGMLSLRASCTSLVLQGVTTVEEMIKIIYFNE